MRTLNLSLKDLIKSFSPGNHYKLFIVEANHPML
jgi:hypothetical protein